MGGVIRNNLMFKTIFFNKYKSLLKLSLHTRFIVKITRAYKKKLRICVRGSKHNIKFVTHSKRMLLRVKRIDGKRTTNQKSGLHKCTRANKWLRDIEVRSTSNYIKTLVFKRHIVIFLIPAYSKNFFSNNLKLGLFKRMEYSINSKY